MRISARYFSRSISMRCSSARIWALIPATCATASRSARCTPMALRWLCWATSTRVWASRLSLAFEAFRTATSARRVSDSSLAAARACAWAARDWASALAD